MPAIPPAPKTFLNRIGHRWRGRALLLPLGAGMAALLPLQVANVMQSWHAWPPAMASGIPEAPRGNAAPQVSAATLANIGGESTGDNQPAEGHLLAELSRRKTELAQREQDLQMREMQLAAAVKLARKEIAELTRMREAVETLVGHEATASEADLNLLVGLYSNMKPVQAAAVLGKLEAPRAAAILQRLDTKMAGPVLAAMDPSAALAITEELQQRREVLRR